MDIAVAFKLTCSCISSRAASAGDDSSKKMKNNAFGCSFAIMDYG
jgi:hypothetical protein